MSNKFQCLQGSQWLIALGYARLTVPSGLWAYPEWECSHSPIREDWKTPITSVWDEESNTHQHTHACTHVPICLTIAFSLLYSARATWIHSAVSKDWPSLSLGRYMWCSNNNFSIRHKCLSFQLYVDDLWRATFNWRNPNTKMYHMQTYNTFTNSSSVSLSLLKPCDHLKIC